MIFILEIILCFVNFRKIIHIIIQDAQVQIYVNATL